MNINSYRSQANLVPNPSFEEYSQCPEFEDQIHFAVGWNKFSEEISTPDYYNFCGTTNGYGVPKNLGDYQIDNRNCSAYAGLITFATNLSNYREMIGIQLNQQLIIGQTYYVSFYTVLGQSNIAGNHNSMPSNNIGVRLSTVPYNEDNPASINNFAHLKSDLIINDSINWTKISGSFISDSTYNYLTIGNFFSDLNTDTTNFNCQSCLNYYSYYFVDDICISSDPNFCNNIEPCDLSTSVNLTEELIKIYPNPFDHDLNIFLTNYNLFNGNLILYDLLGNIILNKEIHQENNITLNLSEIPKGYYMLKIVEKESDKSAIKKITKH